MKFAKNKTAAITIAILLTISMAASMTIGQNATAHSPAWQIPTYAYINVAPNPVGVGQSVNVGFWIQIPTPTASESNGDRWTGLTVKVTHPDGTTETLGPFTADATGGTHTTYTPTVIGNYTFKMFFGGQTLAGNNPPATGWSPAIRAYIGDYYEPSNSSVYTLTVQQEPVGGVSVAPLPTNYWQTPINAMNVNNWYAISGASLKAGSYNSSSNYNPYTTAPMSAHILWTKPEAFGGVLGGQFGGTTTYGNYYSTADAEVKYTPVIINGYLYYNVIPGSSTTPCGLVCVNLYTGQTVWTDNSDNYGGGSPAHSALTSAGLCTAIWRGQILDYVSPCQYGGLAYIWTTGTPAWIISGGYATTGTTLNMFDAETGTYILSIVNGTLPSITVDQSGNMIGYYINATAGTQITQSTPLNDATHPILSAVTTTGPTLNMWNSTLCITTGGWSTAVQGMSGWYWRPPQNGIIPFHDGITWSMPLATNISGNALPAVLAIRSINSGTIITWAPAPAGTQFFQGGYEIYAAYSSTTGRQLWIENVTTDPYTNTANDGSASVGNGVWTIPSHQNSVLQGYSMTTGQMLWTDNLTPFDPYDSNGGWMTVLANGTLYVAGFGGDIWSINMLTGHINWYTNTTQLQGSAGTNTPYGIWPLWGMSGGGVAGGILFLQEGHEYSPPLFLGAQQLAINCTNGKLVWSIDAFDVNGAPVIAYGVMPIINAYDNQIYAYGRGPSKTTVTAPNIGVTTSTPVTITGTVTDISAGSQQQAVAANFPNGLPCVSDASMTQFMEAVYEQQPMPTNVTGVPVTLSVLDSNGNHYNIGTATTTASGFYSYTWTPDIPGNYTLTATFAGTQSYYGSSAQTAFYASSPAATAAPTATPVTGLATASDLTYGIVAAVIVMIIAIAIVGLLLLRKKP
jgi:hypothetical protein